MGIAVTKLEMRHFEAVATRNRIHDLTDKDGGPSYGERQRFAESRKHEDGTPLRNVVKYWPWKDVLAACDHWGIEPVLTKIGRNYVKASGGLEFSRGGKQEPMPEPKAPEARPAPEALKVKTNEFLP